MFVRLAGCNWDCNLRTHGFKCDTDFSSRGSLTATDILLRCRERGGECRSVILTGGEPTLQADDALIDELAGAGYSVAIETNGSRPLPKGLSYVAVGLKRGQPCVLTSANEVRLVIRDGDLLPEMQTLPFTTHYFLSPAHDGDAIHRPSLDYCIDLVLKNPKWRLSVQQHKFWRVR